MRKPANSPATQMANSRNPEIAGAVDISNDEATKGTTAPATIIDDPIVLRKLALSLACSSRTFDIARRGYP